MSNASLEAIVDIITLPNQLDQASIGTLIRNLYPVSKVPDSVVIKVVGSLGHGRAKPSYTAQAALLKWLIMVYDVLESQRVLSRLYSVLFNLLDTIAIRYGIVEDTTRYADFQQISTLSRAVFDHETETCPQLQDPGSVSSALFLSPRLGITNILQAWS